MTAATAAMVATSCRLEMADERPNIILLMGDDHGWDEVAYNGHPHLKTPVLDEMAAQGLRLDRFYSAHPSCSPTRGSVITGRHPNRYGTFAPNWSIRPDEISIAQILKKAGYACGHFGKWHLGPVKAESPTSPGAMGFDQWLSHDNFFEINPTLSRNGGTPEKFHGESSQIIIDETIQFIKKAKKKKQPFFTVVWFGSPHEPYSGLDDDLALYDNLPDEYKERVVTLTSNETGRPVKRPMNEVLRERYAEITAMDRAIGSLRNYLKAQNLRQNTLVWYCGDNGVPSSGRITTPFRGQKGTMYEGGVRVPGVIEWPDRIRKPRVSNVNSVTSDMFPTLCELAGQPLPDRPLDGISLIPLIDGKMLERPSPIFFWSFNTGRAFTSASKPYIDPILQEGTTPLVKMMAGKYTRSFRNLHYPEMSEQDFGGARTVLDNRYKLVVDAQSRNQSSVELFDLTNDPAEEQNLVESNKEIAENMGKQLRDWQKSVLESLTGADYR
ncbi:MAG: sulfatase-like hydrolase/transferase [Planctomycetes bacterium]|nr:sulfatase-like hydrolase/transferase [Planctomycetota bacterium]